MPPLDAFYFPSSIAYVDKPGSEEGILLIANANFDKRYKNGSFVAVDLSTLGLPAFGAPPESPAIIEALNILPENALKVSSFSGRMGRYEFPGGGGTRFFLPSRSEGALLHVIDMNVPSADGVLNLRCFPKPAKEENNCTQTAFSLTSNEKTKTGLPRAPSPGAAVVSQNEDKVWITHMDAADSPANSLKDYASYAVCMSATEPQLTDELYMPIGSFPSDTALPLEGKDWVFLTGRGGAPVLRMLSKTSGEVVDANIESTLSISEGRDLALSSDRKQIFLLGRYPDMLLVLRLDEATSPPSLRVVRELPLPEAPVTLHVLQRPATGDDLIAILSSGSSALSFYDPSAGILTGQLPGLGDGPFSMASSVRGSGARLFIANFSDGRIAVVDIENLARPHEARLVAFLGKSQKCLTEEDEEGCE